jgi:hypothetical protein
MSSQAGYGRHRQLCTIMALSLHGLQREAKEEKGTGDSEQVSHKDLIKDIG